MKKTGVLHGALSRLIAELGHGDILVIGDAGLPVPPGVPLIDLAVCHGVPRFAEVLHAVLAEMQVERCVIAQEASAEVRGWMDGLTPKTLSHAEFKALSTGARAVVRTGEVTPYANIALIAGVTF